MPDTKAGPRARAGLIEQPAEVATGYRWACQAALLAFVMLHCSNQQHELSKATLCHTLTINGQQDGVAAEHGKPAEWRGVIAL